MKKKILGQALIILGLGALTYSLLQFHIGYTAGVYKTVSGSAIRGLFPPYDIMAAVSMSVIVLGIFLNKR